MIDRTTGGQMDKRMDGQIDVKCGKLQSESNTSKQKQKEKQLRRDDVVSCSADWDDRERQTA